MIQFTVTEDSLQRKKKTSLHMHPFPQSPFENHHASSMISEQIKHISVEREITVY